MREALGDTVFAKPIAIISELADSDQREDTDSKPWSGACLICFCKGLMDILDDLGTVGVAWCESWVIGHRGANENRIHMVDRVMTRGW